MKKDSIETFHQKNFAEEHFCHQSDIINMAENLSLSAADINSDQLDKGLDGSESKASKRSGGRRKQSKPVRVQAADEELGEDEVTSYFDDYQKSSKEANGNGNISGRNNEPVDRSSNLEKDGGEQPIICPECGADQLNQSMLVHHLEHFHHSGMADQPEYPTRYHKLASELRQSIATSQLERIASTIGLEKFSPNKEQAIPATERNRSSAGSKENSLSKHNSHILEAENGNGGDLLELYSKFRAKSQRNDITRSPLPDMPISFSNPPLDLVNPSRSHAENLLRDLSMSASLQKPGSVPGSLFQPVRPDSNRNSSDIEDYCDRCQKHFCNKYYLRKHKQDVHGVVYDSPCLQTSSQSNSYLPPASLESNCTSLASSLSQRPSTTAANHSSLPFSPIITSLPFVLPYPSSLTSNPLILSQSPISSAASFLGSGVIPGMTSMASLMFLNPFASPLTILKTPPFLQAAQNVNFASSSLNTLAELQNIGGSVSDNNPLKNNMLYKFESTDQAAHCEICRKEFCNMYFLKVHKRDKHGIPLDDNSSQPPMKRLSTSLTDSSNRFLCSSGVEPGENPLSSSKTKSGKISDDKLSSHPARNEDMCCLCKKQFSNRYSLMMHLLNTHNIKPEGFGLASELLQLDNLSSGQALAKAMTGGSGVAKLSDRVACNICNKEVCNKYFLKTHKMKVHGLDTSENGQDNKCSPNDLSFNEQRAMYLDQLALKHDEMAKRFLTISAELESKCKETNYHEESKKEKTYLPSSERENLKIPPENTHFLRNRKMENQTEMFTTLDLIAKNKVDPRNSDISSLTVNSDSVDTLKVPTIAKHLGASSSKNKPSNHSIKQLSSKDSKLASDKLSEEELIKSGIDPEAYCEICKKEFCSKYFLRTHKQKIHGVRGDGSGEGKALPQGVPGSNILATNALLSLAVPEQPNVPIPENTTSKTKEATNMTRVTCEICAKELCNKYFLKTHMMKIHGASDTASAAVKSGASTSSQSKEGVPTSQDSFTASDVSDHQQQTLDTSVSANPANSDQDDAGTHSKRLKMENISDSKTEVCDDVPENLTSQKHATGKLNLGFSSNKRSTEMDSNDVNFPVDLAAKNDASNPISNLIIPKYTTNLNSSNQSESSTLVKDQDDLHDRGRESTLGSPRKRKHSEDMAVDHFKKQCNVYGAESGDRDVLDSHKKQEHLNACNDSNDVSKQQNFADSESVPSEKRERHRRRHRRRHHTEEQKHHPDDKTDFEEAGPDRKRSRNDAEEDAGNKRDVSNCDNNEVAGTSHENNNCQTEDEKTCTDLDASMTHQNAATTASRLEPTSDDSQLRPGDGPVSRPGLETDTLESTSSQQQRNDCVLQPFTMRQESKTTEEESFAQCKVFLPVVQPIHEPITLTFTVTPLEQ